MRPFIVSVFVLGLVGPVLAAEATKDVDKVDDAKFKALQELYTTKVVFGRMVEQADKAPGIGMVLKPEDKRTQAVPVWIDPKDPEWVVVKEAFKEAAKRKAADASKALDKYKLVAPPEEKKPEPAKK